MSKNLEKESWMNIPNSNDPIKEQIAIAIQIEKSKFQEPDEFERYDDIKSDVEIENNIDINSPLTKSINNGYCKIFAQRVYKRIGEPNEVEVKSDKHRHTWIEYDNKVYDSDCPLGVNHPSLLPVYNKY